jgi:hypothetical protein
MTRRVPRRVLLLLLAAALLAAIPLSYQLREIVRQTVVIPAMYLLWQAGLLVQSVDSLIWWAAFLALALALFWQSVERQRGPATHHHTDVREVAAGRVAYWAGQITKAENSDYTLWQTQRDLAQIAADLQAHGQQPPVGHAAQKQAISSLGAPPGVAAFLSAGLDRLSPQARGCGALFGQDSWLNRQRQPIGRDLAATVAFLEDKVEAGHGNGHPADVERE